MPAPDPGVKSDRGLPPSTPGWVKASGIIMVILLLAFVILHLTGHGFGGHMHMASMEHGPPHP